MPDHQAVPEHPTERVARFNAHVARTATCWWWDGAPNRDGYGRFWYRREDGTQRVVNAHIFAWEAAQSSGTLHDAAAIRMHICNHTLCVRIHESHVTTGTQHENILYADMLGRRRGRAPVRQANYAAEAVRQRDAALGKISEVEHDLRLF